MLAQSKHPQEQIWQIRSEAWPTLGAQGTGFFLLSALYSEHSISPLACLLSSKTLQNQQLTLAQTRQNARWQRRITPATRPVCPQRHLVDHHSAAPGQQVPLGGHLTAQGVVLHLPHPVHLACPARAGGSRGGSCLCSIRC